MSHTGSLEYIGQNEMTESNGLYSTYLALGSCASYEAVLGPVTDEREGMFFLHVGVCEAARVSCGKYR